MSAGDDGLPRSGAPLFTFDADKTIRSWNRAAEELTGFAADDVVGRSCWEALCAHDEAGGLVCHSGCSFHRLLLQRWPVVPPTLLIRTTTGPRRVQVPMVALDGGDLFGALLLEPPESAANGGVSAAASDDDGPPPELTPRQHTVLAMLAAGKPARAIAGELHLSEMTVRNHIRAILRAFGCNSQLTAVAKARRLGFV